MIKKLIISAVILTALIHGKEANAAGPGGLARMLASPATMYGQVAANRDAVRHDGVGAASTDADFARRLELSRVNAAVNRTIYDVDSYLAGFDRTAGGITSDTNCFDCADLKRERLISLGWSADALRIAYIVTEEGRMTRVLVATTGGRDVVLGDDSPIIALSAGQPSALPDGRAAIAHPIFHPL